MNDNVVPLNSMFINMQILADGDLRISSGSRFDDEMSDEECMYYMDLVNGLNMLLTMATEFVIHTGTMARVVADVEFGDEIGFEPDEELLEAMADAKVVNIKDRLN